jgi:hypothetical protein
MQLRTGDRRRLGPAVGRSGGRVVQAVAEDRGDRLRQGNTGRGTYSAALRERLSASGPSVPLDLRHRGRRDGGPATRSSFPSTSPHPPATRWSPSSATASSTRPRQPPAAAGAVDLRGYHADGSPFSAADVEDAWGRPLTPFEREISEDHHQHTYLSGGLIHYTPEHPEYELSDDAVWDRWDDINEQRWRGEKPDEAAEWDLEQATRGLPVPGDEAPSAAEAAPTVGSGTEESLRPLPPRDSTTSGEVPNMNSDMAITRRSSGGARPAGDHRSRRHHAGAEALPAAPRRPACLRAISVRRCPAWPRRPRPTAAARVLRVAPAQHRSAATAH